MLLTFVIPTYNRGYCVSRAIDSVLEQLPPFHEAFEIIIVDDGSTDTTPEVLSAYSSHDAVSVVRLEKNSGLGTARNTAFARARGTWCALLDSDNALLARSAPIIESLLSSMPPDIGVVWFGCRTKDGAPTIKHGEEGRIAGGEILRSPLRGEHFPLVRTELVRGNPYPLLDTAHACEPAFWAKLAQATDFWIDRTPIQHYDTTGEDRFCALPYRLTRATDLAVCYRYTARLVAESAPKYAWELKAKAAYYRSVHGDWWGSICEAVAALPGIRYSMLPVPVAFACIAGPWVSRQLLRLSFKATQ
jgi:glycosyltransferase involved in cell wall biosynthesis